MIRKYFLKGNGFSLIETVISLAIFFIILSVIISSLLSMNNSSLKTLADREAIENSQRILDAITYEIRSAKSVYTPTTNASQISLETVRYLPSGQTDTFIDFFKCGTSVCLKKEFQNAISLTPDTVEVESLIFSQVTTGSAQSITVNLTLNYSGSAGSPINLTSTASLRGY